jgi:hypothetical protein
MLKLAIPYFGDKDLCTRHFGKVEMAGNEIGMKVGFQDVGDFQIHRSGRVKIDLNVPAWINNGTRL